MKTKIIIPITIALISFSFGWIVGYSVKEAVKIPKTKFEKNLERLKGSKFVDAFCANLDGEVTQVNENSLILSKAGDSIEIKFTKDTRVFRIFPPKKPGETRVREESSIEKIKVGDVVTTYVKLTDKGELETRGINIQVPQE